MRSLAGPRRQWRWIGALCLTLLLAGVGVWSDAQSAPVRQQQKLRVAIKPLTPFVMVDEEAAYHGFSIELWEEVAERLEIDYEYHYVESVDDQLEAIKNGVADLAITGISMTKEREEAFDFSMPYFRAGLQMLVRDRTGAEWTAPLMMLQLIVFSPEFLSILAGLGLLVIIIGHLFWFTERRNNPDFPSTYIPGVWEGIWYAVVTLMTVGYGDRTAKSIAGRLLAMLWMLVSIFLVANFTANITSRLTLSQFDSRIRSVADMAGHRIATVEGSTAAEYLSARRLPFIEVAAIEEAYALLENDKVDIVVYDSPVLLYYANGAGQGKVRVVGDLFEPQQYAVAFPPHSRAREPINRALLEIVEDGVYDHIYSRWFSHQAE